MANMSYCRFENTVHDMRDCVDALDEMMGNLDGLSDKERRYAEQLLEICRQVAADYPE